LFSVFSSVTVRPFAFAIFQSVSPLATVIVLVVVDVVGAVVVGWVTVGAVTGVLLSVNTCPGTMTSEVRRFNVFSSATLTPLAFANFQSVSPDATVIVLAVDGVVGVVGVVGAAGVVGCVTIGVGVVVVCLSNNVWPGTMTSLVKLFSVFSSATLKPFAFAIFQSVSPDATFTVPVVVPGVTVGVVGVVGVTEAALFKSSVCPVRIASLVRLFSDFNSATVNPFVVAIFHNVSPDTTTTLLPVDGVVVGVVGVVTPGVTVVPLM